MHNKINNGDEVTLIPKFQTGTGQGGLNLNVGSSWIKKQGLNLLGGISGSNNPYSTLTSSNPTGAIDKSNLFERSLGGALQGGLSAFTNFSGINRNDNLNADQKRMAMGDAGLEAVASAASAFGPIGSAIGTGLGLINKIGGSLIKTPKILKDFTVNDTVNQSSGFTGIAANSNSMKDSANSYANAGLVGKIFGKKKKLVTDASGLNSQQAQATNILNDSKLAFDRGIASTDMFANNNQMKLFGGSQWTTNGIQYGQSGMKFAKHKIVKGDGSAVGDLGAKLINWLQTPERERSMKTFQDTGGGVIKTGLQLVDETGVSGYPDAYNSWKNNDAAPLKFFNTLGALPLVGGPIKVGGKAIRAAEFFPKAMNLVGNGLDMVKNYSDYKKSSEQNTKVAKKSDGGSVKTYEEYKKLCGAAVKLDLKKIKVKTKLVGEPKEIPITGVKKHEEGGVIEQNVIVDGKLHAHKHTLKDVEHLEDANITLKGVPVISQAEGGEIVQHAEVEKDELILHHSLSKKLEDLYEEGTEEAMIQAGRILTRELIKNTVDSSSKILENG